MRYRIACSILLFLAAVAASAQNRVFVSAQHGDDSFACSATAPCRSFAHAYSVVATNGEILALDSGGYGTLTISKSVSVVAPPGVEASITQNTMNLNAIDIVSGAVIVTLRGLSLFGLGIGNDGIRIEGANNVIVQSCNVSGFVNIGLELNASIPAYMSVSNSTFNGNQIGILTIGSSDNQANFSIDHVHLELNNLSGLGCGEGSRGAIRDSIASVSQYAIQVSTSGVGRNSSVDVENCTMTRSAYGIYGQTGATSGTAIRVSNSLITNNTTGVYAADPFTQILSRGNNSLSGNDTDGTFNGTFTAH